MRAALMISILIMLNNEAWSAGRSPFHHYRDKVRHIKDCMYVTSKEGEYIYKKTSMAMAYQSNTADHENSVQMVPVDDPTVCGLYIIAPPYKNIKITFHHLDASCKSGALLGFVDGWELNGEYFPSVSEHHLPLEERVTEFCVEDNRYPLPTQQLVSSQNSALLQYRIPKHGSFMVSVKFFSNPDPCHIMADESLPYYVLKTTNKGRNCTLTSIYPAVVSVLGLHVGNGKGVNYECTASTNKLTIGGSSGLDSSAMETSAQMCGNSDEVSFKQAIFCGVTTVRLSTSYGENHALIALQKADVEEHFELGALFCEL